MQLDTSTITLTFGDRAENHAGMQLIGKAAQCGISVEELLNIKKTLEEKGIKCRYINLTDVLSSVKDLPSKEVPDAGVLIIEGGVDALLSSAKYTAGDLFKEQAALNHDTKAFMYGRVVEKHARHNLCFDEKSQEPLYEQGKGRIVAYDDVPVLRALRNNLPNYFGEKAKNLTVEGNYYFDKKECGIGYHGDGERKIVIAARLGATIPLHYQWYFGGAPIGENVKISVQHGDIYIMSEKAVGTDWKKKTVFTLRHAAGAAKFTSVVVKKKKQSSSNTKKRNVDTVDEGKKKQKKLK